MSTKPVILPDLTRADIDLIWKGRPPQNASIKGIFVYMERVIAGTELPEGKQIAWFPGLINGVAVPVSEKGQSGDSLHKVVSDAATRGYASLTGSAHGSALDIEEFATRSAVPYPPSQRKEFMFYWGENAKITSFLQQPGSAIESTIAKLTNKESIYYYMTPQFLMDWEKPPPRSFEKPSPKVNDVRRKLESNMSSIAKQALVNVIHPIEAAAMNWKYIYDYVNGLPAVHKYFTEEVMRTLNFSPTFDRKAFIDRSRISEFQSKIFPKADIARYIVARIDEIEWRISSKVKDDAKTKAKRLQILTLAATVVIAAVVAPLAMQLAASAGVGGTVATPIVKTVIDQGLNMVVDRIVVQPQVKSITNEMAKGTAQAQANAQPLANALVKTVVDSLPKVAAQLVSNLPVSPEKKIQVIQQSTVLKPAEQKMAIVELARIESPFYTKPLFIASGAIVAGTLLAIAFSGKSK